MSPNVRHLWLWKQKRYKCGWNQSTEPVQTWKYWAKVGSLLLFKKMSFSQNLSHIDFYNHFFEPRPSLIFMATTSALITPVSVGLFYFTIWFEINGPDARRSLINRLVTPICTACIIYLLLPQTIDLVRYFYGPLPDKVCFFNIYIKNAVNLAGEFFYIFLLLAR